MTPGRTSGHTRRAAPDAPEQNQEQTPVIASGHPRKATAREFAAKLERLLAEKGMTQSELARRMQERMPEGKKVGQYSVSSYVTGKQLPRAERLIALAAALEIDPDDLLLPDQRHTRNPIPRAAPRPSQASLPPAAGDGPQVFMVDLGNGKFALYTQGEFSLETAQAIAAIVRKERDGR